MGYSLLGRIRAAASCDLLSPYRIPNEEASEWQKTNDQLSSELRNTSLLGRVRALCRKRRKREREERKKTEQILCLR